MMYMVRLPRTNHVEGGIRKLVESSDRHSFSRATIIRVTVPRREQELEGDIVNAYGKLGRYLLFHLSIEAFTGEFDKAKLL